MARIGIVPKQTCIEIREPDGDTGEIPGATLKSAGVMTAQHVRMLEEVFRWFQTSGSTGAPMIIERPGPDMSQYPTKLEVKALLTAMPKMMDMSPQINALRGELLALQSEAAGQSRQLLMAPPVSTDAVDQTARVVLDQIIAGYEALDHRVRQIEAVMDTLRAVADIKAQEAA